MAGTAVRAHPGVVAPGVVAPGGGIIGYAAAASLAGDPATQPEFDRARLGRVAGGRRRR